MNIKLILKGFIVGLGKIIPGVSGSMLAITLGIYENILEAVTNFFNNPKSTGYKAFNCFYDNWAFNTEIQMMTKEMRDWTNATHNEHNKRKYGDILTRK